MALGKSIFQRFARLALPRSGVSTDFLPGPAPEEGYFGLMQNKGDHCSADLATWSPNSGSLFGQCCGESGPRMECRRFEKATRDMAWFDDWCYVGWTAAPSLRGHVIF